MIDLTPSEEQAFLRDTARRFAREELAPAVEEFYAQNGGRSAWPALRPAFELASRQGLVALLVPEEDGGGGASCVEAALVFEELGAVDVGAAASYFALTATLAQLIARRASEEQTASWLAPLREGNPVVFAGALSEPDRAGSDLFSPSSDPGVGPATRARPADGGYVLEGAKSAFVTNGGIADGYLVVARTRSGPPAESLSMFYVPADTPGLRVGRRTELAGWRTAHHAELVLDSVFVPANALIGDEGKAASLLAASPEIPICLAACYVGLARAAYEYAAEYAATRVSWGEPIRTHQAVALKLAEAAVELRAARLLVWEAADATASSPERAARVLAPAAKVLAVDVAIRNAQRAVEILGGYGVAREYRAARYLADAWVGWACDFTRDLLLLGIASSFSAADLSLT